jgi:dienelactone hydrolase
MKIFQLTLAYFVLSYTFALAQTGGAAHNETSVPDKDIRTVLTRDYNTHFEGRGFGSRGEWEARRSRLRRQILFAAGLSPMPQKTPLNPKVIREIHRQDYSIEVMRIEVLPGYFLYGNLYRPAAAKKPVPGILLPHGHWKHGRAEDLPSYSVPALGINLARQGYVAFAYDMVGYNDTRQIPHSFGRWDEQLWSFNTMGLQLWNSIRALDYLQSLPEVDSHRIAVTGASGGATQTFLLTAVDDRVKVSAPVNMISAYMQGGDPCEEAPNLRLETSNVEFAAMMAPRPMLIVSSTRDWTRHTPSEEFPWIRHIYSLYGATGDVENTHIDAEHNYNRQSREAVYRFFAQRLQMNLDQEKLIDQPVEPLSVQDLLASSDDAGGELGEAELFQMWKATARFHTDDTDKNDLRQLFQDALGVEWPSQVASSLDRNRLILSEERGDRVEAHWIPGKGNPVLLVHPDGVAAALQDPLTNQVIRSGRPLLIIEPFRSSAEQTLNSNLQKYFFSYNRSEYAYRVQDIVTALSFLKEHEGGTTELVGLGEAGVWCLFAAASTPIDVDLLMDLSGFSGSDTDFRDRFFVPGIQHAGGLRAALRLVGRTRAVVSSARNRR